MGLRCCQGQTALAWGQWLDNDVGTLLLTRKIIPTFDVKVRYLVAFLPREEDRAHFARLFLAWGYITQSVFLVQTVLIIDTPSILLRDLRFQDSDSRPPVPVNYRLACMRCLDVLS